MFITRESDYALRIIRDLSYGTKRSVKEICGKEQIPQQYAYKILKKLEKGRVVQSFRGTNGGYILVRPAKELTMYDVLAVMDEDIRLNECMSHHFNCPKNSIDRPCKIHKELCSIQHSVIQQLKGKTMAEILE